MKRFVQLCAASLLSLSVLATGMAEADKPAKKRKPTFFEQIFGADRDRRKADRRVFGRRDRGEVGSIRVSQPVKKKRPVVADSDPEGDPGLGMGNLRYAAPRLVAMSGIKLDEPRPFEPSAGAIHDQLAGDGPSLQVLPATREAVIETYRKRNFRPVWIEGERPVGSRTGGAGAPLRGSRGRPRSRSLSARQPDKLRSALAGS
jgi:hypothetical protein